MREAMRAAGVERRREGESPEEEERRFRERLRRFAVPDYAVTTRAMPKRGSVWCCQ